MRKLSKILSLLFISSLLFACNNNSSNENENKKEDEKTEPSDVTPTDETPKDDTPKDDTPTDETPKDDTPKDETPKDDDPVDETPKDDTPVVPELTPDDYLLMDFDFDTHNGSNIINHADDKEYKIDYLFNESNQDRIFKESSDPLFKQGVGENSESLYLDGHSTKMKFNNIDIPENKFTVSCWIAPRGFENVFDYDWNSIARGHQRMTSILNQGNIEIGEGFLFGYGRLGKWGLQLNLVNNDTYETKMWGFYDPLNKLELYKWNHICASFDGDTGYIGLFFNGQRAYESYIPELRNTSIAYSGEPLYMGYYVSPMIEFGCNRQLPAGLIDNLRLYETSLPLGEMRKEYQKGMRNKAHPDLPFDEVKEDRSIYEGDRYRSIYHGIPSAVWMNEPHAPIYYKGYYHLFYQHNPIGPYWSQIRWAHLASTDMIHWVSVKDAVVPTEGICPEGVWTGGSVIGPDGTPWLIITAGTNQTTWTGQNVAYAHCVDPNDPLLTDWVVEDKVVVTQPADDSMGEREQFRDPFVWYDDGLYYMLVSTSIPGRGGSANIFTSKNMRDWTHHGYLYECPFDQYPQQGAHWECVIMLPIKTKDGSIKKWILFDCPQYTVDGYVVDCYYWIGNFNKSTCRFEPDNHEPQLFDLGKGIYTGQTGFCYLTEEEVASGKSYQDGRTVLFGLAQGKSAGTEQNIWSGWAHSLAMPVDLYLDNDGKTVIREPIKEIEGAYDKELYSYSDSPLSADAMNMLIGDIRGDALRIDMEVKLDPVQDDFNSGLYVRYNKNTVNEKTEKTGITFDKEGVYIYRGESSEVGYVDKSETNKYFTNLREFDVTILLDRSCLEVYINNVITFTTRIYPKYGNSDFLNFFDINGGLRISNLKIIQMKSVYYDKVTPAYYGNTGNLGE